MSAAAIASTVAPVVTTSSTIAGRSGDCAHANAPATFRRRSSSLRRLCMRVCRTRRQMSGSIGTPISRAMRRAISSAWLKAALCQPARMQRNGGQRLGHFQNAPLHLQANAFGNGLAERPRQVHPPAEFQAEKQSVHRIVVGERSNHSMKARRPDRATPAGAGDIGPGHADPAAGTSLFGAGEGRRCIRRTIPAHRARDRRTARNARAGESAPGQCFPESLRLC